MPWNHDRLRVPGLWRTIQRQRVKFTAVAVLILALRLGLAGNLAAAEPIALKVDGGELHGTLEVPQGAPGLPVALIIAGSGPTDRNGNNPLLGKNNCLKMLAESLAAKGVASLRYDKRGIGASARALVNEADLRFETFIADAEGWGRLLLRDRRFTRLIIIGHSEGALIGTVACRRLGAQGFVSMAGAGFSAFDVLKTQLKENSSLDLLAQGNRILDLLEAGKTTDKVPLPLMDILRPSVQPYLISWFRYDPAREISKLKVPSLITHGTTDTQLSASNAERLAKANHLARLLIVKGMNHVLKIVPMNPWAQLSSYGNPNLPISRELVDNIAAFIKEGSHQK